MKKYFFPFTLTAILLVPLFSIHCKNNTPVEGVLEISGQIEAVETEIRPQVSGQVVDIRAKEGQQVIAGDLLCTIDDRILTVQIQQVQSGLDGLRAKLRLFKKGTKTEIIAMAQNQLDAAREEKEQAQKDQARMSRLLEEGAVSESQKEKADLRLKAAAEAVESAEENLNLAQRGREKEEIEIVEAEIQNLLAQEELLKIQMEETRIVSPVDGTIETRHIEVGEMASPLLPLFSLIDLNQSYVKAYVPEQFLGQITLGSGVEVICDSFPEKVFKGKVDFISDQAEFAPKNIQTKEERLKLVFMIKSYLDNRERILKPGMPVDVRIDIRR